MARLQILELPEGTGDDQPPFVLVIDQYEGVEVPPGVAQESRLLRYQGMAEQIGARAVLVFEETIDIPANDTSAFAVHPNAAAWTEADKLQVQAAEGVRLAHEHTDIARDSMRDAIQRVRDLPDRPELMNAQQPNPTDYLHGYRMAILDAKQATREPEQARNTSGD